MHSFLMLVSFSNIGAKKFLFSQCVNAMNRDKKYLTSNKWLSALSFVVVNSAILIIFIRALAYSNSR